MKADRRNQVPKARHEQLIVKELPDELLIYDLKHDQAHCLNETAALVWKNCDGRKTVDQLRELMEDHTGSPVPQDMIWLALDQLETFKLLNEAPEKTFQLNGMSRRSLVKRIGFAAIALPAIVSIVSPTAQAQASGLAPGRCCGNPTQCASNNCAQTPTCTSPPAPSPSTKACA